MATAGFPKISPPSCSVPVYLRAMNQPPGNILIISQILPTTNDKMSSHEYSMKSLEERLKQLEVAHPLTSSQQSRTWAKNVQNVVTQTTAHKIIGQGEN